MLTATATPGLFGLAFRRLTFAAFAVLLVTAVPAAAELTKLQSKCVQTLTKDGSKVSKFEGKLAEKCMKDGASGKLSGTADECIAADGNLKVAKSKGKTLSDEAGKCPEGTGFVTMSGVQVNASSQFQTLAMLHGLLGSNLEDALQLAESSSKCQQSVQRAMGKVLAAKLKSYGKCLKGVADSAVDISSLNACLEATASDSKVLKAVGKLATARDRSCSPSALSAIFPGSCSGAATPIAFDACADALAECRACTILGGTNGLSVDCDLFDNGVADLSCEDAAPVCGDGNVDPGEECDPGAEPTCCSSTCTNELDGLACDDSEFCNGAESCLDGVCVSSGDPCAGGSECNVVCNESSDNCFDPAGIGCGDDGNECTDDECDGAGNCVHPGNTDPCTDDGNECTDDVCDGAGTCSHPGNFNPCADDGNVCTNDVCDGAGTCSHPGNLNSCDDSNACTTVDVCNGSGTCVGSVPPDCNDGNGCTDDFCDAGLGCQNINNSAPCNDGMFCNGADTCGGGSCSVHAGDPCVAGSQCNVTCNEGPDTCFDPSGTVCDSGAPGPNDACDATNDTCDGSGNCVNSDPAQGPELCYVVGDEDCDGFADTADPHANSLCATDDVDLCQCSQACDIFRISPTTGSPISLAPFAPWGSPSLGTVTLTAGGNANPGQAARTFTFDFNGKPSNLTVWWALTDDAAPGQVAPRGSTSGTGPYAGAGSVVYSGTSTRYSRFGETFACTSPPPPGCPAANTWELVTADSSATSAWGKFTNLIDLFELEPLAVRDEAALYLQNTGAVEMNTDPFVVTITENFAGSLIQNSWGPARTDPGAQYGVLLQGALYGTLRNANVCP